MQKIASFVLIVLCSSLLAAQDAVAEKSASTMDTDRSAIESAIQSYVDAFNAKDANAMAQHWSPEGVYISKLSGERVEGRQAIAAALGELFREEGERKLNVSTASMVLGTRRRGRLDSSQIATDRTVPA